MVFSTNQVRHLYVVKGLANAETGLVNAGDALVKTVGDVNKEMYLEIMGAETPLKSDYIPVKNIKYAKAVKAADMADKMKKVLVTVDSSLLTSNKLKYTEDYVLRINLRQFYGMSDEDQYFKDAVVHGVANMAVADFYAAMADALNLSFAREVGATKTSNPYLTFTGDASGITIEEKPQHWTLGVEAAERVLFEVVPTTIYNSAVGDVVWGKVADQASTTTVGNGQKIADLEYFCLGERGDQYRKIGWPNDIETKGLVDPTQTYDVLEMHYTFNDTGVNSYSTEKDITIVCPSGNTTVNAVIGAINAATGLTIATLA